MTSKNYILWYISKFNQTIRLGRGKCYFEGEKIYLEIHTFKKTYAHFLLISNDFLQTKEQRLIDWKTAKERVPYF